LVKAATRFGSRAKIMPTVLTPISETFEHRLNPVAHAGFGAKQHPISQAIQPRFPQRQVYYRSSVAECLNPTRIGYGSPHAVVFPRKGSHRERIDEGFD
jgi:hypothetical protein